MRAKVSLPPPIKVFISYARKDERHKKQLAKNLASLKPLITIWDDSRILGGDSFEQEIERHIKSFSSNSPVGECRFSRLRVLQARSRAGNGAV